MVAPFGNTLHVSGTDRTALESTLSSLAGREGLATHEVPPSLEDVFIHHMRGVGEPARPEA
jgi:ABC-2 type transport system ATP-binding protein